MRIEIIGAPLTRLSMNDRMHWRPKARLTAAWRRAAFDAAIVDFGTAPSSRARPACEVRVHFPVRQNRRRDPHNAAPTVKAIVDGLVDAGVWPDDTDEYVVVLDPRFYKPDQAVPFAPVIVELTQRSTS